MPKTTKRQRRPLVFQKTITWSRCTNWGNHSSADGTMKQRRPRSQKQALKKPKQKKQPNGVPAFGPGFFLMLYCQSLKSADDGVAEPITTAQAKEHLRVDHDSDDAYIATLIKVVRQSVEISTGRALTQNQTISAAYQFFPRAYERIVLPRPPFVEMVSLQYYDANQELQTVTEYEIDNSGNGCAYLSMNTGNFTFPTLSSEHEGRVIANYRAGYAVEDVPAPLYQAMLLLLGHYYDTREPVAYNANPMPVPRSVDFLCRQYKVRQA